MILGDHIGNGVNTPVAARDIVGRDLDQDAPGQAHSVIKMAGKKMRGRQPSIGK